MGIHKSLGYGLNLSVVDSDDINYNFDKLNDYSFLEDDGVFHEFSKDVINDSYINDEISVNIIKNCLHNKNTKFKSLSDFIVYDNESGNPNFINFIPGMDDLKRYDDIIDYTQEGIISNGNLEPNIIADNIPIYPFSSMICEIQLDGTLTFLDIPMYKTIPIYSDSPVKPPSICYYLLKYIELVPPEKLNQMYTELRTSIYTYWS